MTQYSHQTAPTQFVEADGIRFAYRRFGKPDGVPLVFNMHYIGTSVEDRKNSSWRHSEKAHCV